jgi:hypothetical protein
LAKRFRTLSTVALLGWATAAPSAATALQIEDGDFIGIFVKNGVEVIVNMGAAEPGAIDLSSELDVPAFGGTLEGVKFVGLAVEDPGRTINCCGQPTPLPQPNLIYTSLLVDPTPTDSQIALAMEAVDNVLPGSTAWFNVLRQLPGTDSEEIAVDELFSYTSTLGLGTDAVANNLPFSTAAVFDANERITGLGVYLAVYGYEDFGGPETEYLAIGNLGFDGPNGTISVPEASQVLGTLLGFAVLGAARVRRRIDG